MTRPQHLNPGRPDPFHRRGKRIAAELRAHCGDPQKSRCPMIYSARAVVLMSACVNLTRINLDVRFGSEADIPKCPSNVRFTPKRRHSWVVASCPLPPQRPDYLEPRPEGVGS